MSWPELEMQIDIGMRPLSFSGRAAAFLPMPGCQRVQTAKNGMTNASSMQKHHNRLPVYCMRKILATCMSVTCYAYIFRLLLCGSLRFPIIT